MVCALPLEEGLTTDSDVGGSRLLCGPNLDESEHPCNAHRATTWPYDDHNGECGTNLYCITYARVVKERNGPSEELGHRAVGLGRDDERYIIILNNRANGPLMFFVHAIGFGT